MLSSSRATIPAGSTSPTKDRVVGYQSPSESPSLLDWFELHVGPKLTATYNKGLWQFYKALLRDVQNVHAHEFCTELIPGLKKLLKGAFPNDEVPKPRPDWLQAFYGVVVSVGQTKKPVLDTDFQAVFKQNGGQFSGIESILRQAISRVRNSQAADIIALSQDSVNADFEKTFEGTAHQALHTRLKRLTVVASNDDKVYARVLPIIQSSGTGKTRTAIQLGTLELGLYICIRPEIFNTVTSAPAQDALAYEFLKPVREVTDFQDVLAVASFLAGFFEAYGLFCLEEKEKLGPRCSRSQLIEHTHNLLTHEIARPAGSTAGRRRDQLLTAIDDEAIKFYNEKTNQLDAANKYRDEIGLTYNHWEEFFATKLMKQYEVLQNLFPQETEENFVHLAIDEAMSLGPRMAILRRLLSYTREIKFWVLILDTNNQVSKLSGYDARAPSSRALLGGSHLIDPFMEMPQNIFLQSGKATVDYPAILSGAVKRTHSTVLALLPLMGRPMWNDRSWRLLNPVGNQLFRLKAVFEKLLAGRDFTTAVDLATSQPMDIKDPILLAAASQRLPLHLAGVQGNANELTFLEQQVANHLRIVTHVDSSAIRAFSPSEPLLSLAVAHEFKSSPAKHWSAVLLAISNRMTANDLHVGENGEEFIRILMSIAMDMVQPSKIQAGMVRVQDWLEQLFGPKVSDTSDIQAWSKNRWINFTHFARRNVQYTESKPMSREHFAQMWTRQVAILGVSNQEKWDILIVSLFSEEVPTLDQLLQVENLCPILIQTKLRSAHSPLPEDRLTELGRSTYSKDAVPLGSLNIYASLTPRKIQWEHAVKSDPRDTLSLYIGGSGEASYPIIGKLESPAQNVLQRLIGVKKYPPNFEEENGADAATVSDLYGDHSLHGPTAVKKPVETLETPRQVKRRKRARSQEAEQ